MGEMPIGVKGAEGVRTAARNQFLDGTLNLVMKEADSSLNPNSNFARRFSMQIFRIHGINIGNALCGTLGFILSPELDRTNVPRDDRFARQRALIGHS